MLTNVVNYGIFKVGMVISLFSLLMCAELLFSCSCEKLVGTDEATTCLGIVIRNRRNGMYDVCTKVARTQCNIHIDC